MKAEKLQKHMDRGTIVHGQDTYGHTIGKIVEVESCGAIIEGFDPDANKAGRTYYSNGNVRKATDDEIVAYEAFKPAAPEVGTLATAAFSEIERRALIGCTVEIVEAYPTNHNGDRGEVVHVDDTGTPYQVRLASGRGWWARSVRVVSADAAPKVEAYKAGDRVQLRAARNGERRIGPTFFAPGTVVTIEKAYDEGRGQMYEARGVTIHIGGGPHSQCGLAHADIVGLAPAEKIELIGDVPADAPKRLTVGDKVVAVRYSGNNLAYIGTITRDDNDSLPYKLDVNEEGMFRETHTFPRTIEGFRAAAAIQKAAGVVFEEGDFVATYHDERVLSGTIRNFGGALQLGHSANADTTTYLRLDLNGPDRVVVLCKAPKV